MAKDRKRGTAKPSPMTVEEARRMCREHVTVPLWPHAGQALGMSRDKTYTAARDNELPTIKVGSKVMMATAVLSRMLGLEEMAA